MIEVEGQDFFSGSVVVAAGHLVSAHSGEGFRRAAVAAQRPRRLAALSSGAGPRPKRLSQPGEGAWAAEAKAHGRERPGEPRRRAREDQMQTARVPQRDGGKGDSSRQGCAS